VLRIDAGGAVATVIPSATNSALSVENAVDVVVLGGVLRLIVNGTSIAEVPVKQVPPTGQIGVFVGKAGGVSFDNLVATGARKR